MRLFIAAAAILCMALGAGAETLDCTHIVYEEDLSSLSLGRVTAGRRVNFVLGALEGQGCPSAAPECRSPAFLLPGDEVVFDSGLTSAGLSCVTFVDRKGPETSRLPTARIALTASAPNWIGRWKRNTSAEIDIAPKSSGKAEVNGSATWGSGAATHDGGILHDRHGARYAGLRLEQ